jgi:multidrug efflux pump subunit AcrA (membrane-fusion protein)
MKHIALRYSILAFTMGIIPVLSMSCGSGGSTEGTVQKTITPVTVTTIKKGDMEESIELPAQSTFLNKSIVRSSTTGTVEKVLVTFGDYVKRDQMIFTLKTKEASIIAGSIRNDSTLAFRGEIKIQASRDGLITSVSHQGGDFVQEGDELAVISDRESFVFILEVPYEINSLAEHNSKCTLVFPDGKTIAGSIGGQLPEMDQTAQTLKYFIKAPFGGILPSNLNIRVRLVKRENPSAIILPRDAVLGNETQTEFWIMKLINDSVAIKVPVKKGIENRDKIEISGPALGLTDRIIVTGGYGLPDTANVVVKK